jgi:predicted phosphoribosyltransferase
MYGTFSVPARLTGPAFAVADAYKNWYDLTDEEVIKILERA